MTLYALDGTSNRLDAGPDRWTHIALLAAARARTAPAIGADLEQPIVSGGAVSVAGDQVVYQSGVGSGWAGDRFAGGATGLGAKKRVRRAYDQICRKYATQAPTAEELHIDIIGFSRGAATALHLANVIYMMGIRQPRSRWPNSFTIYRVTLGWLWFRDWKRLAASDAATLRQRVRHAGLPGNQLLVHDDLVVPRIRFLGLFDAVSSFALPMDTRVIDLQSFGFGFRLHAPPNVANCSHAMALDERRTTFRNVRVHQEAMDRARVLRSEGVSGWFLAAAMVLAGYAAFPGPAGSWVWIAFIAMVGVAATHIIRGSVGSVAAAARSGERVDLQEGAKDDIADRLSATTGLARGELDRIIAEAEAREARLTRRSKPAGDVGKGAGSAGEAPRRDRNGTGSARVIGPAIGILFAIVTGALVDLLGPLDISGVGFWDYLVATVWAYATLCMLMIAAPVFVADTTSLRSSQVLVRLAGRKVAATAVATIYALATWWLTAIMTDWWDSAAAEPWTWRVVLVMLGVAVGTGFALSEEPKGSSAKQAVEDGLATAVLAGILLVAAWVVRRLASRGLDLVNVPWWQYLAVAAIAAGIAAALGALRAPADATASSPPTIPEEARSVTDIERYFDASPAHEVWFRGNHTDIGGGGATERCNYTLAWMTAEAHKAGLEIDLAPIGPALAKRPQGSNPTGIGPTFDPFITSARRLVLDGDPGHWSIEPPEAPVPERPQDIGRFNATRLLRGSPLQYDPRPDRSAFSRAIATRFLSPHPPRFIGVLAPPSPNADGYENYLLEGSAGMRFAETQQRSLDRWR